MVMLTGALLSTGLMDDLNGTRFRDRTRARTIARAGLNEALYQLSCNPTFDSPVHRVFDDEGYDLAFTPGGSVNNLLGVAPGPANCRGNPTPAFSADLLVTGYAGNVQVRLHGLASRGNAFLRAVGADGKVNISGGSLSLDGVVSLSNPTPAGGGIFSNYLSSGAADPAVLIDSSSGPLSMSALSRIETRPGLTAGAQTVQILPSPGAYASQLVPAATPPNTIPNYDVATTVSAAVSKPAPPGLISGTVGAGPGWLGNQTTIAADSYQNGNVLLVGDLNLTGATLYVHGDLNLLGGIVGCGSVFVDGNVNITGGVTAVQTTSSSGAALYASGNVLMQGVDGFTYLQGLSATVPAIATAVSNLQTAVQSVAPDFLNPGADNGSHAFTDRNNFIGLSGAQWLVVPIQNSDQSYPMVRSDSPSLALAAALRTQLGASLPGFPPAVQAVSAMEQLTYQMRGGIINAPGSQLNPGNSHPLWDSLSYLAPAGVVPLSTTWDDCGMLSSPSAAVQSGGLPGFIYRFTASDLEQDLSTIPNLSWDHQYEGLNYLTSNPGTPVYAQLTSQLLGSFQAYAKYQPYDLHWLGNSQYQGIVYARGNITLENNFSVIGALLSNGNVTITSSATLTYDQEYFHTLGNSGSLALAMAEEL